MKETRQPQDGGRQGRLAWAFYDWANSSFAAIISTFIFPAYFARQVVGDEARGTELWGYTLGAAGLLVAITGPLLGAVADQYGRRKPMLRFFTLFARHCSTLVGSDYIVNVAGRYRHGGRRTGGGALQRHVAGHYPP